MDIAEIKHRNKQTKDLVQSGFYEAVEWECMYLAQTDFLLQELEKLQQESERITKQRDNFGTTLSTVMALSNHIPDGMSADELVTDIAKIAEDAFERDEDIRLI